MGISPHKLATALGLRALNRRIFAVRDCNSPVISMYSLSKDRRSSVKRRWRIWAVCRPMCWMNG